MSMINCQECSREKKSKSGILSVAAIVISLLALLMSLSTEATAAQIYDDDYDYYDDYEDDEYYSYYTLPDGQRVICNEETGECVIVGDEKTVAGKETIGDKVEKEAANKMSEIEDEEDEIVDEQTDEVVELKYKDFTITKADGESFTLSDNAGKLVFINFWATWCGYCTEELPDIQRLYDYYKDSDDVKILALNSGENTNAVHRFIVTNGYDMPVGYDESASVSAEYGVEALPYSVLIDGSGNIVEVFDGLSDYESFKAAIEKNRQLDIL